MRGDPWKAKASRLHSAKQKKKGTDVKDVVGKKKQLPSNAGRYEEEQGGEEEEQVKVKVLI